MAIKGKEELKKLNTLQVKLQSEIEAIYFFYLQWRKCIVFYFNKICYNFKNKN
ncbi:hypothetical protein JCM16775_0891 [Leptotrichia hofstadii]|uniref:Uncharacterized protein n=1 Tax=Leptotrichia hofstadii TaxID=157688 RepID=A0A510JK23_9FUSO|nr:hypothetical protein [Leptotrichia hofstadii]BBM38183.1 hypothetical protein JCM16775_0891 [Leptotrichia hofstadii]